MQSSQTALIGRLVRAASRANIPLPDSVGVLDPNHLLDEAVAAFRSVPEGTSQEELLAAFDRFARQGGFDDSDTGYLVRMLYPRSPLEVLSDLSTGQRDLALALAQAHRDTSLLRRLSLSRHELFAEIAPHMDLLDALDVVSGGVNSYSGSPLLAGFFTAEDAALLLSAVPDDARFSLRYGPMFSLEDTLALLRFGGRAGAVLAVRAGHLSEETVPLLLQDRSAVELLEIAVATNLPGVWPALSARFPAEVLEAIREVRPSGSTSIGLLQHVRLSEDALLELFLVNPNQVPSWAPGTLPGVNRFSASVLERWAARTDASTVRVAHFPRHLQQQLALSLRGVAPKVKRLLERDNDQVELRILLSAAAELFGGEPRLWTRLATAEPSSPFGDRTLTLVEATNRYWDRWNAAAARRASR